MYSRTTGCERRASLRFTPVSSAAMSRTMSSKPWRWYWKTRWLSSVSSQSVT